MLVLARLKKLWLERQLLNRRAKKFDKCDGGGGEEERKPSTSSTKNDSDQNPQHRRRRANDSIRLRKLLRSINVENLSALWNLASNGDGLISDCIECEYSTTTAAETDESLSAASIFVLGFNSNLESSSTSVDQQSEHFITSRLMPLSWCRLADHENDDDESESRSSSVRRRRRTICCNPYHYGIMVSDIASSSSGAIDGADDCNEGQSGAASCRQSDASNNDDNVEEEKERHRGAAEKDRAGDGDTGFFSETSGTNDSNSLESNQSDDCPVESNRGSAKSSDNLPANETWCHIAYWENDVRSGPLLAVSNDTGLVYYDHTDSPPSSIANSCLRLAPLVNRDRNVTTPADACTIKTRTKIGLGVALFRRKGSVWLYNRSNCCVFVRSNTWVRNRPKPLRLSPGYCCRVHRIGAKVPAPTRNDTPRDPPTVLISFGKGWGRTYERQFITCCPCWVQVIFNS